MGHKHCRGWHTSVYQMRRRNRTTVLKMMKIDSNKLLVFFVIACFTWMMRSDVGLADVVFHTLPRGLHLTMRNWQMTSREGVRYNNWSVLCTNSLTFTSFRIQSHVQTLGNFTLNKQLDKLRTMLQPTKMHRVHSVLFCLLIFLLFDLVEPQSVTIAHWLINCVLAAGSIGIFGQDFWSGWTSELLLTLR